MAMRFFILCRCCADYYSQLLPLSVTYPTLGMYSLQSLQMQFLGICGADKGQFSAKDH